MMFQRFFEDIKDALEKDNGELGMFSLSDIHYLVDYIENLQKIISDGDSCQYCVNNNGCGCDIMGKCKFKYSGKIPLVKITKLSDDEKEIMDKIEPVFYDCLPDGDEEKPMFIKEEEPKKIMPNNADDCDDSLMTFREWIEWIGDKQELLMRISPKFIGFRQKVMHDESWPCSNQKAHMKSHMIKNRYTDNEIIEFIRVWRAGYKHYIKNTCRFC